MRSGEITKGLVAELADDFVRQRRRVCGTSEFSKEEFYRYVEAVLGRPLTRKEKLRIVGYLSQHYLTEVRGWKVSAYIIL